MNTRFKLKVIAAVAAAAVITLPGLARADAIAQSILDISSFKFMIGNNAAGGGTSLVGSSITINPRSTQSTLSPSSMVSSTTAPPFLYLLVD